MKTITLCWYASTPNGWRYFPCLFEKYHGMTQARHGWVMDKGVLTEYPHGRYVLRSYVDGSKQYTKVESCNPRDAALALAGARRQALNTPKVPNKLAILKTAVEAYIADRKANKKLEAARDATVVLNEFIAMTPVAHVRSVTKEMVLKYHKHLEAKGQTDRTIANKHQRLRAFFRFCKVDVSFMPEKPKYDKKKVPVTYTSEQIEALLMAAAEDDEYLNLMLLMGLKMGLRELEIAHAEWSDIQWEHSVFHVQEKPHWDWKPKDQETREVPVPTDVMEVLKARRESFPKTTLILGTKSNKPNFHLLRALKRLVNRSGLACNQCRGCIESKECSQFQLHTLRRSYATTMLRNGFDVATVQKYMGHSDLASTMRYLRHASAKESQEKINSINW